MNVSRQMIKDAMSGLDEIYVSDRKLAEEIRGARHLRSGRISKVDHKELAGTEVYARAYDELGNIIYLAKDGIIRQAA